MRITKEQEEYLKSFKCERLSAVASNEALIESFYSKRGELLVNYLKSRAWQEDINGDTAFYLIKNSDGIPCLFFSLKCGSLFEPFDEKGILQNIDEIKKTIRSPEDLIKLANSLEVSPLDLWRILGENLERKLKKIKAKKVDEKKEPNEAILRVYKNLPGIELAHFCTDDNEKKKWNKKDLIHSMGESLFWYYIVPTIEKARKLIGCQYVFLFAADSSIDNTLKNYYESFLKFSDEDILGTSKPYYDFGCLFMHQKIENLLKNKESFFDSFNADDDDILI